MPRSGPTLAWIARQALEAIYREAASFAPNETGGVLMGYWAEHWTEVVITDVIGPGPNAVHHSDEFVPDCDFQESAVAAAYEQSGRLATYLGDWHTHPGGATTLSRKDRRTLRAIARHRDARAPRPLMALLGGCQPRWRLQVWRGELVTGWLPGSLLTIASMAVQAF